MRYRLLLKGVAEEVGQFAFFAILAGLMWFYGIIPAENLWLVAVLFIFLAVSSISWFWAWILPDAKGELDHLERSPRR